MSGIYKYNITEDLKSGVDLYTIAFFKNISSAISIDSESTISVLGIRYVSLPLSGDISFSSIVTKIAFASSNIEISGASLILGTREKQASIFIDASSVASASVVRIVFAEAAISSSASSSISASKTSYAASTISSTSTVVTIATKVKFGSSLVSISSTVIAVSARIRTISASINAISVTVVVGKQFGNLKVTIPITGSSLVVNAIRFAVNNNIDTSGYKTLLVLDNKPLTNQGRTFSSDLNMDFIESKNWNNTKSRYYKRQNLTNPARKTFVLSWTFLPNSRYDTIDKRYARDYVKSIASDPDIHTLKMLNNDSSGNVPYTETEYNVFVRDYSEVLTRRDLVSNIYFWECSMTLEEA